MKKLLFILALSFWPLIGQAQQGGVAAVSSTAAEASHLLLARQGILRSLVVYNGSASAQYIQLHDSATLPANATVPVVSLYLAAGATAMLNYSTPLTFSSGIVVCNSSTGLTKTLGAADCLFSAQVQ